MKKYAESKGFFDFKAERELYSIVKAWGECSSQRREGILLSENCKIAKQVKEYRWNSSPRKTTKTGNLYRKKNRQSQEPIKTGVFNLRINL